MADFIVAAIVLIMIAAAVVYMRKAKKSGVKCIGCPSGGECSRKHSGNSGCGCGCHADTK